MPLYEDFLDKNNLYSRPSSLMSDVNDYLGANQASLPQSPDTLGGMAGLSTGSTGALAKANPPGGGPKAYGLQSGQFLGVHIPGADISGQPSDLIARFASDVGSLDENQQSLFKALVLGTHGDMQKGVSAEEWAQLFGVSKDYSGRFQGFPQLSSLFEDIQNVHAFGGQQRGFEQKAAQEALIASGGGAVPGLRMGSKQKPQQRRMMQDTLNQRFANIREQTSAKYNALISAIQGNMRQGFTAAAEIKSEDPDAGYVNTGYNSSIMQANHYFSTTPTAGRDKNWRPGAYATLSTYDKQKFDEWWNSNFG